MEAILHSDLPAMYDGLDTSTCSLIEPGVLLYQKGDEKQW